MTTPNQQLLTELKTMLVKHFHVAEQHKEEQDPRLDDARSLWQAEYDRVIFSDYFRALSRKTQVEPNPDNDHTHTRLTHSLEVASLGFSLGKNVVNKLPLTENESLDNLPMCLATACLVHDIGNPSFGHAGEEAIQHWFEKHFRTDRTYKGIHLTETQYKDLTYFDGNAYGFRVLTRLAGRRPCYHRDEVVTTTKTGLGLLPLTLLAFTKYPFASAAYPNDASKKKFGYLQSEQALYTAACTALGHNEGKRHPLVYLVEACDDLSNLIMDCEDAIKNGHLTLAELEPYFSLDAYSNAERHSDRNLAEAIRTLRNFDRNKPILLSELKALETLRSTVFKLAVPSILKVLEKPEHLQAILNGQPGYNLFEAMMNDAKLSEDETLLDVYKKFKKEKLYASLYCHTKKMTMELSGSQALDGLLTHMMNAMAAFKEKTFQFDELSSQHKHWLRLMGVLEKPERYDDYELVLLCLDALMQHADTDLIKLSRRTSSFGH